MYRLVFALVDAKSLLAALVVRLLGLAVTAVQVA